MAQAPRCSRAALAELICRNIAVAERVSLQNTGSEATSVAIRLSRAVTGRQHFIVVQGGYNGNHDELACNVVHSLAEIGPRVSPGNIPCARWVPEPRSESTHFVHPVNFNDLDSVATSAAIPDRGMITEPILQNIGVVRPRDGYLAGLRELADEFGFLLIFDEVKTGFRHSLGGYAEISRVNSRFGHLRQGHCQRNLPLAVSR